MCDAASDGSLVGPNGGLLDENFKFIKENDKVVDGNFYMSGWCLCASKKVFDPLIEKNNEFPGPFSEAFGIAYFEDTDLSFRARDAGVPMKIVSVPLFHFGKMTSRKLNTSELYVKARNIFVNRWTK